MIRLSSILDLEDPLGERREKIIIETISPRKCLTPTDFYLASFQSFNMFENCPRKTRLEIASRLAKLTNLEWKMFKLQVAKKAADKILTTLTKLWKIT